MDDSNIFKIALITTILGLSGMLLLADNVMPHEVKIKNIDKSMLDADIMIEGVVTKIDKSSGSNTYFMQIMDDTGKITAVIFPNTIMDIEKTSLNVNSFKTHRIKMTGKVTSYNGNLEIILKDASSIKVIA
jgi:DNA/RNA endonuclease YhcR with UshA esterase domain